MKTTSTLVFSIFLCMPFAGCSIEESGAPATQEDGVAVNEDTSKPDDVEGPDRVTVAPAAASKGPCFLGVPSEFFPADKIEVLLDGKLLGTFGERKAGAGLNERRLTFQGGGQMQIVYRIYHREQLAYKPKFTMDVEPGTMLASSVMLADEKPMPDFGPGPDCSFPALIPGVPEKIWCWFGPAPVHKNLIRIVLAGEESIPSVRKQLAQAKYDIAQEKRTSRDTTMTYKLALPKGKTIVEATLELEGFKGVKSAYAEITHVY